SGFYHPVHYNFDGVTLTGGGQVLYSEGDYNHMDQSRYRIVAWTDGQLENIERTPNYNYWAKGKFVPAYQLTNDTGSQYQNLTAAKVDSIYTAQTSGRNDDVRDQGILEQGIIYDHMPGTGGRWDIGAYPAWTVSYLLAGGSATYERILHADGNGAGSFYIHVRQNGAPGYDVTSLPSGQRPLDNFHRIDIYGPGITFRPDHAHAPSLGYAAYLMTGDKYYAEEVSFWASYQLGEWPYDGMDLGAPERAQAWGFRHVVDAAFVLPNDHPLMSYFEGRIDAYAQDWQTNLVSSGRKVHFMKDMPHSSGRLEWVNANFCSAWQTAWLVWSLGNAVDKGFDQMEEARDWIGEYIVGFYTSDDEFVGPDGVTYTYDPKDAMPYSTATSVWNYQVVTSSHGYDISDKTTKIKNLDNYGEIWYWTKVNQDNEYSDNGAPGDGLKTYPDAQGNWPLRDPGWGHGFYNDYSTDPPTLKRWWAWHRYGAWDGLVSAYNGQTTDAVEAWNVMVPLAEPAMYGFSMLPAELFEPDDVPPGAVGDLAAGNATSGSVELTWTSTGDDYAQGTATAYDIRCSDSPISLPTWASATPVTGEPAPLAAGTGQSMTVGGLASETTWYFAMTVEDDHGNVSGLSNVAVLATLPDGGTPAAIADLAVVGVGVTTLDLTWTAPGDDGMTGTADAFDLRYLD
ncbi:MAG: fibronectin type III domain-containing protein, partial [Planctomycetota bacterium]